MEVIDIILGIALLYGLIKGISKGFFAEVASLIALIMGIYGAIHFSSFARDILTQHVALDPKYIKLASFAVTFVVIVVGISLAGKLLTKLANLISLGFLNTILGAIFGVIKIGLILSVLIGWFEKINGVLPFISDEQKENSILFTPIKNLAPTIFPTLLDKLDGKKSSEEQNEHNETKNI